MMFNENGVAYAPWVAKQINEEVGNWNLQLKRQHGVVINMNFSSSLRLLSKT